MVEQTRTSPGLSRNAIIGWTIGMLAVLGTAWFIGGVAWPIWRTRVVVADVVGNTGVPSLAGEPGGVGARGVEELGGPETAAARLAIYTRLPAWVSPHRQYAMRMMRVCGVSGCTELAKLLGDHDPEVRREAALSLGWVGEQRRRDYFLQPGKTFRDHEVQELMQATARDLERIDDPAAVDVLIRALRDEDIDVRGAAVTALGMTRAARAGGPLAGVLGSDREAYVRYAAAWALGRIGEAAAIEPLSAALRDKGWRVPSMAAWALAQTKDRRVVPVLMSALRNPDADWTFRRTAYEALGDIGPPALDALMSDFGGGNRRPDYLPAREAGKALVRIGRPAVQPLVGLLGHPSHFVRFSAVRTLGEIGDPDAILALENALGDQNEEVREAAAEALAAIRKRQRLPFPSPR